MSKINNGAEKKQLDFNNLMKAVSGLNPNKMKHLTEEDLQEQLSLSKESEKKEEEVKDSSVHETTGQEAPVRSEAEEKKELPSSSKESEKKEEVKDSSVHETTGQEAPVRSEAEGKREQLSSSKENKEVQSPFSYENIIRKSNTEDGQFTTFKLKRETLDMLDAIARGSEKNVSKSTIIHNLVSTFLTENLEKLKAVAAKKIKRDYLK